MPNITIQQPGVIVDHDSALQLTEWQFGAVKDGEVGIVRVWVDDGTTEAVAAEIAQ